MNRKLDYLCLALLVIGFVSERACADNWPAWRGDGSGVSAETGLPTEWSPHHNVRWKTRLEGQGISSPIVWGDRVFVTWAVDGVRNIVSEWAVALTGCALAILVGVAAVFIEPLRQQIRPGGNSPGRQCVRIARVDRLAMLVVSLLFAVSISLGWIARESIIEQTEVWLIARWIGILGVLTIVGFVEVRSVCRPTAAGLLLTSATLLHVLNPIGVFGGRMDLAELLALSIPLTVAAIYLIVMFLLVRQRAGLSPRALGDCDKPTVREQWRVSRWRLVGPLGVAASGILVVARIHYFKPEAEVQRGVSCFDIDTGAVQWRSEVLRARPEATYWTNSFATPTPATDGEHVIAHFGPGMACLDFNGTVLWRASEPQFHEFSRYGAAASPLIYGDRVIDAFMAEWTGKSEDAVSRAYARHSHVTARRIDTGELLWQAVPPSAHDSYGSPVLARRADPPAVLFATWGHAVAYAPDSGRLMWECDVPMQQIVPSIVADEDRAYVLGGTHGPRGAVAIRLGGSGNVTETHVAWMLSKRIAQVSSPVLYKGLLFWVTDEGIASCVEAETGEFQWKARLDGHYSGSPVAGDDKVYYPGDDGDVTVVRAAREFEIVARNSINESSGASPAIANGCIFIRGEKHLFCIGTGPTH